MKILLQGGQWTKVDLPFESAMEWVKPATSAS